jgi:hypothetical protein
MKIGIFFVLLFFYPIFLNEKIKQKLVENLYILNVKKYNNLFFLTYF